MGDSEEKDWAHAVAALEPYAVTAVVAGSRNSLAICQDGRVRPRLLPPPPLPLPSLLLDQALVLSDSGPRCRAALHVGVEPARHARPPAGYQDGELPGPRRRPRRRQDRPGGHRRVALPRGGRQGPRLRLG
jgi:hypothetical protein